MQDLGIFSFLCCVLCIYSVFREWQILSHWIFAASILLLLGSIILSGLEINKSTKAIKVNLSDIEKLNGATIFNFLKKMMNKLNYQIFLGYWFYNFYHT